MKKVKLMLGDNIESLKKLPDNSIDSVVTDPPYGLSFMNKKWDYDVPSVEFWKEVLRVLKPGGHVLSFGGTRTYHRMAVNIEDAGFEIRDQIMWLYGSGFPKSHNIGKAVDKIQGNEREVLGEQVIPYKDENRSVLQPKDGWNDNSMKTRFDITKGQSPYEGWGTSLKPANEPICVARKPLSENTIVENVLRWGTGGINVDRCRVGSTQEDLEGRFRTKGTNIKGQSIVGASGEYTPPEPNPEGRFPANIILDEIAGELLDEQSGINSSRFFYQAKVSKAERNMGLDEFEEKESVMPGINTFDNDGNRLRVDGSIIPPLVSKNTHPTVKPVALMAYLCRLVTPPNGIVLDPFMGSGSTGISAQLEGFRFVGMEMDPDYFKIAQARIDSYEQYKKFIK
jgi:site-specific DNA-methyltransferase (adenine-specific)